MGESVFWHCPKIIIQLEKWFTMVQFINGLSLNNSSSNFGYEQKFSFMLMAPVCLTDKYTVLIFDTFESIENEPSTIWLPLHCMTSLVGHSHGKHPLTDDVISWSNKIIMKFIFKDFHSRENTKYCDKSKVICPFIHLFVLHTFPLCPSPHSDPQCYCAVNKEKDQKKSHKLTLSR